MLRDISEQPSVRDPPERQWLVVKDGRVFALLDEGRFADMFWADYRVLDLTRSAEDRELLHSSDFWHQEPLPIFVHLTTGFVCDTAFAGGYVPSEAVPLVSMRGLHAPMRRLGWRARWARWLAHLAP
jgi:hypothetical protein